MIPIYTNHEKLTMQIITTAAEPIRQELLASIYRGVTVTEGYGGYTLEKKTYFNDGRYSI